jgi:hypothetical protein
MNHSSKSSQRQTASYSFQIMTIPKGPPTIMVSLIMPQHLLPQDQTAIIRPEQHTIQGLEDAMWSLFASKTFGTTFRRANGPLEWVRRIPQPTHKVAFCHQMVDPRLRAERAEDI